MARTPQTAQENWLLWPWELVAFETQMVPGENTGEKVRSGIPWGNGHTCGHPTEGTFHTVTTGRLSSQPAWVAVGDPGTREEEVGWPPAMGFLLVVSHPVLITGLPSLRLRHRLHQEYSHLVAPDLAS